MALTTLTWRALVEQTPATNAVADYLAAIKAAFDAATYKDGSARTAGSGNAWSTSSAGTPVEAVCLTPPSGSGCSARVVAAGYNGAKTPGAMAAPDSYLSNGLHALVSSNGGTLGTWDGATPLGAGIRLTGYTRFSAATTGGALGLVRCFECAEAVAIFVKIGSSFYGILAGALWDPYSSDALDAESDGRVYGYLTGGSSAISATFNSSTSASFSGIHGASAGDAHGQWLQPGTSTLRVAQRLVVLSQTQTAAMLKGYSGNYWSIPSWYYSTAGTAENMAGELRSVRIGARGRLGQKWSGGGAVKAYFVGGNDAADADTIHLMY